MKRTARWEIWRSWGLYNTEFLSDFVSARHLCHEDAGVSWVEYITSAQFGMWGAARPAGNHLAREITEAELCYFTQ